MARRLALSTSLIALTWTGALQAQSDELQSYIERGRALAKAHKYDQSLFYFLFALERGELEFGAGNAAVVPLLGDLAEVYLEQGQYRDAEPLLLRSVEIQERQLADYQSGMVRTLNSLGALYEATDRPEAAIRLYRRVVETWGPALGSDNPSIRLARGRLADLAPPAPQPAPAPTAMPEVARTPPTAEPAPQVAETPPVPKPTPQPGPAPAPGPEVAQRPAPAPTPEVTPQPAPAPAPQPEVAEAPPAPGPPPEPAPAPAPQPEVAEAPPAPGPPPEPAPAPAPQPEVAEAPAAPPAAPVARPEPAAAKAPVEPAYHIHLTSIRRRADAPGEWARLQRLYPEPLAGLSLAVTRVDLGPEKGIWYRVHGGLLDETAARRICAEFRARNLWCNPTRAGPETRLAETVPQPPQRRPAQAAPEPERKPPAPAKPPQLAIRPTPPPSPAALAGYRIHLTSIRHRSDAEAEWARLQRRYPALLAGLSLIVTRVDLGPEKGIWYRIQGGPLDAPAARRLCAQFAERRHWCDVMPHAGGAAEIPEVRQAGRIAAGRLELAARRRAGGLAGGPAGRAEEACRRFAAEA